MASHPNHPVRANPAPDHRWANLDRAAKYADTSVWTLRRAIARGDLPAKRLGRVIKIDLDDLDHAMRVIPSVRDAS